MDSDKEQTALQNTSREGENRRKFLSKITLGVGSFVAAVLAVPVITSMLDPVLRKKTPRWRKVGSLEDFEVDKTKMVSFKDTSPYKWSTEISQTAAYVRREQGDTFTAFSINCAHLGCPVRWVEESELFLCPCHGGVYYKDGSRASGPPPRGLFKYPIRVVGNNVEIKTAPIPITNMRA
ncbi:MAG: ubiquinol-cytochrome c reductase iron-sulfur subunit [Cyclobacteriaceae bacterium]|nr:ubiquinol-cytochrome c reductase iron-sulfur subunit [Cyclobacteriaceae bacterium]